MDDRELSLASRASALASRQGRAMAHMLSTFAEYEREVLSARVREGIAHAKVHGTKTGRPIGAARRIGLDIRPPTFAPGRRGTGAAPPVRADAHPGDLR